MIERIHPCAGCANTEPESNLFDPDGPHRLAAGDAVRPSVCGVGQLRDFFRRQGDNMVKGRVALDFPIYPGDTIVVEDRFF